MPLATHVSVGIDPPFIRECWCDGVSNPHEHRPGKCPSQPVNAPRSASVAELLELIAEFEAYLADDKAWSRARFVAFHKRFKAFGIGLDTAISDEILGQAKRALPSGTV